jgi:hypothetical protein
MTRRSYASSLKGARRVTARCLALAAGAVLVAAATSLAASRETSLPQTAPPRLARNDVAFYGYETTRRTGSRDAAISREGVYSFGLDGELTRFFCLSAAERARVDHALRALARLPRYTEARPDRGLKIQLLAFLPHRKRHDIVARRLPRGVMLDRPRHRLGHGPHHLIRLVLRLRSAHRGQSKPIRSGTRATCPSVE